MSEGHDPAAGRDLGPCDDFAPDALAPDPADRLICTTCFHHRDDHWANEPDGAPIERWEYTTPAEVYREE